MKKLISLNHYVFYSLIVSFIITVIATVAVAEETLCARVKIEINQELTLERQAFEAHMKINNGLAGITLNDVDIDVSFADADGNVVIASSDPEDTDAKFFIKVDSMEGITDVDGNGEVAPSSSADIYWMIIPAPDSSNGLESGTLYYVGATLKYTIGGEENITEVSPDYIYVKPMPKLVLDYFLPEFVYGDDPLTTEVEEIIPFSLGVRVQNDGFGIAKNLKIDSAQPKIVRNDQDLLIGFLIEGSQVQGEDEKPDLLINLGEIASKESKMARWKMQCSLFGKFTEFNATYSHSDELGGELTSLIDKVETHVLVRETLVDLPGRDTVWDYLARDGDVYRLYESNSTTSDVTLLSSATINQTGQSGTEIVYDVSATVTAGFSYIKLTDPAGGQKIISKAIRSDGKIIGEENIWLSKTKNEDKEWQYFLNIFDVNGTGKYTISYDDSSLLPQAPVIQYISDKAGVENQQTGFLVEASDPNGEVITLSASPLPAGAIFTDNGNGSAVFDWTPFDGQAGSYTITFIGSDGEYIAKRHVVITIHSASDTDGDGMKDSWEIEHFGNLDRDGTGDFEGDGINDFDEYLLGADPLSDDFLPGIPVIINPIQGDEEVTLSPQLIIENSKNPDGKEIVYEYQIFSDLQFNTLVSSDNSVPETDSTTSWIVPVELSDNTHYYWRVRAVSGGIKTKWAYAEFFVNLSNDAPDTFRLSYPSDNVKVGTLTPVLQVNNSKDFDNDIKTYLFEIFADSDLTIPVVSSSVVPESENSATSWIVTGSLSDNVQYFWRAVVTDEHGLSTASEMFTFTVQISSAAPSSPLVQFPENQSIVLADSTDLIIENSIDTDSENLDYYFEIDVVNTFDSPDKISSGQIPEEAGTTVFNVNDLEEDITYYWRVKASDGDLESTWATASFIVSSVNDSPSVPVVKNPGYSAWTQDEKLSLSVNPSLDPEKGIVNYQFEIYEDSALETIIAAGDTSETLWPIAFELQDKTSYYWRVLAEDEDGIVSAWSPTASFFVKKAEIPETIGISVSTSSGTLITGKKVYAFTVSGSYTGLSSTTDESGIAVFEPEDFTSNDYKFRVDYMGSQFWSEDIELPGAYEIDIEIIEEAVTLTVTTASGVAANKRVYLFSDAGSYLGSSYVTDENGQISLVLPIDKTFKFRADMTGHQYWSDTCNVVQGSINNFTIDAGGGLFTVTVQEEAGVPMENIRVYLFSSSGSYLSQNINTDSSGGVAFDLPSGAYKVRVDYLGYQFWSEDIDFDVDTAIDLNIPHDDFVISVDGVYQENLTPIENIKVYLFSPSGSYLSQNLTSDSNGQVVFHLPEKAYKVRADYMGMQFWSDEFTYSGQSVEIPMADVDVSVGWSDCVLEGVTVYMFSGTGTFLGLTSTTGADGLVSFRVPAEGVYKFRADYQSSQFWSSEITPIADQMNTVAITTGGGTFVYKLMKSPDVPLDGVKNHIFSESGTYFGVFGPTNSDGEVSFDLADGSYNIRTDYLGYQFWSPVYNVPETLSELFTILHSDVNVLVSSIFGDSSEPVTGAPVYLFTPSGSYVNMNQETDETGQTIFNIPERSYKVRADYMGQQYWSEEFVNEDVTVDILMADAEIQITWDGLPLPDVSVYALTPTGSYLSKTDKTDTDGKVLFRLPKGTYKFRADYQGSQFWSDETTIIESLVTPIEISTGGGPFVLSIMKSESNPLVGAKCYVFSDAGAYLGLQSTTSSEGQVSFDLSQGNYKFRVDYMGYQFWSNNYEIPGVLSDVFIIQHADTMLTINAKFNEESVALSGATVYLFNQAGAFMNVTGTTDESGQIVFNLPPMSYKVRVDYMNSQFWSDDFVQTDTTLDIPMADVVVTVNGAGDTLEGVSVLAFSETGSYLSLNNTTDAGGNVNFRLPAATYKFSADYQSKNFWSTAVELVADSITPVDIDTGGGEFVFNIKKSETEILENISCYVYSDSGSYLGLFANTDSSGNVAFELSDGDYKIRADYMGYQFWTDLYTIPATLSETFVIPHIDNVMTVNGFYDVSEPLENVTVYLYSGAGSYLNITTTTDTDGEVVLSLPFQDYKLRADYMGYQFWSDIFNGTGTSVTIDKGRVDVIISRSGIPVENAKVLLFTEQGAYMNLYQETDAAGTVQFELPDKGYKFRIDDAGTQTWTDVVIVTPGETISLDVDID